MEFKIAEYSWRKPDKAEESWNIAEIALELNWGFKKAE